MRGSGRSLSGLGLALDGARVSPMAISSLWAIGLFVGTDLIFYGPAWIALALQLQFPVSSDDRQSSSVFKSPRALA